MEDVLINLYHKSWSNPIGIFAPKLASFADPNAGRCTCISLYRQFQLSTSRYRRIMFEVPMNSGIEFFKGLVLCFRVIWMQKLYWVLCQTFRENWPRGQDQWEALLDLLVQGYRKSFSRCSGLTLPFRYLHGGLTWPHLALSAMMHKIRETPTYCNLNRLWRSLESHFDTLEHACMYQFGLCSAWIWVYRILTICSCGRSHGKRFVIEVTDVDWERHMNVVWRLPLWTYW